jgi:hypothetical protein
MPTSVLPQEWRLDSKKCCPAVVGTFQTPRHDSFGTFYYKQRRSHSPREAFPTKNKLFFVLLVAFTLTGCRATGRLYPVQGPLSTQTPPPVLVAKITGAFNSGNISVVLADGEVCKGRWATVTRPRVSSGAPLATAAPAENMSSIWDTVYGSGFYVAHVLGARLYAQAQLQGIVAPS